MADISDELNTIENERNGEPVLTAISSAMTTINSDADITSELYTITNGRYGSDIRMAIHDALYKLSQSGGGGGDETTSIGTPIGNIAFVNEAVTGYSEVAPRNTSIVIIFNGIRANANGYIQFSELNFYNENDEQIVIGDYSPKIESTTPGNSSSESIDKSIDGNVNTKYCAVWRQSPVTVTIGCDYIGTISSFSYTTANDSVERDPVSFTISLRQVGDSGYRTVLTVTGATIPTTRKTETDKFYFTE